jgi:hypothetical protein
VHHRGEIAVLGPGNRMIVNNAQSGSGDAKKTAQIDQAIRERRQQH